VHTDLVIELTQRRRGYFDPRQQVMEDDRRHATGRPADPDFLFRAGCTVLVDLRSGDIRRVIRTPGTVGSDEELTRVRNYRTGVYGAVGNAFAAGMLESLRLTGVAARHEPFALIHQLEE
jgi:hypothetical protein